MEFKTEQEPIDLANDCDYGLGGGVWTQDIGKGLRVARAVRTGSMWVNCYLPVDLGLPFGGYKKSGYGREAHKMIYDSFSQMKNIVIDTSV